MQSVCAKILHKLGNKDSIVPKAFENNNMHFILGVGGGGVETECILGVAK